MLLSVRWAFFLLGSFRHLGSTKCTFELRECVFLFDAVTRARGSVFLETLIENSFLPTSISSQYIGALLNFRNAPSARQELLS